MKVETPSQGRASILALDLPRRPPAVTAFAALVVLQLCLVSVASVNPLALVLGVGFLGLVIAAFTSSFAGLVILMAFQVVVMDTTRVISASELAYGSLFLVCLAGWHVHERCTPYGRALAASPTARALVFFFGLCVVSIVPALIYGSTPLWWLRDLAQFAPLLLFFPIASACRDRRKAAVLAFLFVALVVRFGVASLKTYQEMLSAASHLWQMQWQRSASHEVLATVALVVGFAMFVRAKGARAIVGSAALAVIGLVPLAISLSRGFWAAAGLALAIAVLVSRPPARRTLAFLLLLLVLGVGVGHALFGWKFLGVVQSLGARAESFSSPLSSITIHERMTETHEILKLVRQNPITGHGLGAWVQYMSPIQFGVLTQIYGHNAYLYLLWKLGVVGLVSFLVFYFRGIGRTRQAMIVSVGPLRKGVMTAAFALLLAFIPLSLTSPQYYSKDSTLVIALLLGAAEAFARGSDDDIASREPR